MLRPLASYSGDESYVFVSYSHSDIDIAYPEIRWLQDQGFNVWWDEGISPGAAWRHELAQALRNCSGIIYLVTPNSVKSDQCVREINFGLDEFQRPVLAVHLVETRLPDSLGLSLSDRQAILKYSLPAEDYERKLNQVAADVLAQTLPPVGNPRTPHGTRLKLKNYPKYVGTALVAISLTVATMLWIYPALQPVEIPRETRFRVSMPDGVQLPDSTQHFFDFSSDGQKLYFIGESGNGQRRLFMRDLGTLDPVVIDGAEPGSGEKLLAVFLSPDDSHLLLYYLSGNAGIIRRLVSGGGIPVSLTDVDVADPNIRLHWGEASRIFYRDANVIWEASQDFASKKALVKSSDKYNTVSHPFYVQASNTLLYVRADLAGSALTIPSVIEALSLETGKVSALLEGGSWPRVTATGTLIFGRDNSIWAVKLNVDSTAIIGEPVIVQHGIDFGTAGFDLGFTFSASGRLTYVPQDDNNTHLLRWLGRDGASKPIGLPPQSVGHARVSPNEDFIAYSAGTAGSDLWIYSLVDGLQSRVTFSDSWVFAPLWAPDNQTIAYSLWGGGAAQIRIKQLGQRSDRLLYADDRLGLGGPSSWSKDQKSLLIVMCRGIRLGCDIGIISTESPDQVEYFGEEAFSEHSPAFSPDGQFLGYLSDEFGADRIVIRPYPDLESAYWQIPLEGCMNFEWLEINRIVAECEREVIAIPVEFSEGQLSFGKAESLFTLDAGSVLADIVDDGEEVKFLLIDPSVQGTNQLVVVTNWLDSVDQILKIQQ